MRLFFSFHVGIFMTHMNTSSSSSSHYLQYYLKSMDSNYAQPKNATQNQISKMWKWLRLPNSKISNCLDVVYSRLLRWLYTNLYIFHKFGMQYCRRPEIKVFIEWLFTLAQPWNSTFQKRQKKNLRLSIFSKFSNCFLN